MEALIESIAVATGFHVFCFILGAIYLFVRKFETISLYYLIVSIVFVLHGLFIYLAIYAPGVLRGLLSQYAFFWLKVLM